MELSYALWLIIPVFMFLDFLSATLVALLIIEYVLNPRVSIVTTDKAIAIEYKRVEKQ